jgi:hypothetical protein
LFHAPFPNNGASGGSGKTVLKGPYRTIHAPFQPKIPEEAHQCCGLCFRSHANPAAIKGSVAALANSTEETAAGIGTPFLIEVHYWWNNKTFQVEQAKFKNTKNQGCVGQITTVG